MSVPIAAFQRSVQAVLHRAGFHLSYLGEFTPTRRAQMLTHAGVQDLLDIGANTGQWAIAARRAGYSGRLWSFEPGGPEFAVCSRAARKDPGWHVERCAVGDQPGMMTLHRSENSLFSSLVAVLPRGLAANPDAAQVASEEVPVRTLDEITAEMAGPAGVKMDVQGFESRVLDGGAATLKSAVYLEAELSLQAAYEGEPLYREMLDRIEDLGFRLALVEPVWPDRATGECLQFNGMFLRSS